ncbi:hypothetical protein P170DRAFT_351345 [Aspergillus steynii IBT 23096]|uniref:Uncharacterized protein n=1 Tax=Aspergillus steynii IBT 23096 TaxID=1392250 RepID=A0A2I2GJA0_9EURO|nr:uncharacterized protein P170DRAFT_351345 [Aspergillus steynii IBT 23096]PLB52962.1 hypothetical protein P170DRAFT_351345 [Aspergillus steynii IBT 23096]
MESTGHSHSHSRNISRSSRPRSSTRGPLDGPDDPLGLLNTPQRQSVADHGSYSGESFTALDPLVPDELPQDVVKDLSYLLRYDVYHSLSQVEIPPALRAEFVAPASDESLAQNLGTLEKLLAEGHFLLAAYLSGTILTSSSVSATDIKLIFALFYTRLACLELSGNPVMAAQESKALEDLSSTFYYLEPDSEASEPNHKHSMYPRHIVPWPLRVLAVRLQSIGFGDPRRGIGGLFEIGLEARREIMRQDISQEERQIWKERLSDLGIRSVNALIEMGDLNAARRSLHSLQTSPTESEINKLRKALLFLLIGDLDAAQKLSNESDGTGAIYQPLLSMAEGRYSDAVLEWKAILDNGTKRPDEAMISQNMAAREVLESLVQTNQSFYSLVFNLSTVYELCSDKADKLKTTLVDTVAQQPVTGDINLDRPNVDFKL